MNFIVLLTGFLINSAYPSSWAAQSRELFIIEGESFDGQWEVLTRYRSSTDPQMIHEKELKCIEWEERDMDTFCNKYVETGRILERVHWELDLETSFYQNGQKILEGKYNQWIQIEKNGDGTYNAWIPRDLFYSQVCPKPNRCYRTLTLINRDTPKIFLGVLDENLKLTLADLPTELNGRMVLDLDERPWATSVTFPASFRIKLGSN